jgi:hypothetical protein
MSHEFSEIPTAHAADAQREANPYASPLTQGPFLAKQRPDEPIGVWRSGDVLVLHRDATLPQRCIITNVVCDPSERHRLPLDSRRKLRLAQGMLAAFGILVATGFYFSNLPDRLVPVGGTAMLTLLLIGLFTMRRSEEMILEYSYSRRTRIWRQNWFYGGIVMFLFGLLLFPLAAWLALFSRFIMIPIGIGILLMLAGGIVMAAAKYPLRIERRPGNYLVIHGCGRSFLGNFPQAALGLSFLGRMSPKPLV